jgi:hypothetical protein
VRLVDGDGRNRSDHERRRSGSSAACAPAYSRRYNPVAQEASWGAKDAIGARNRRMAYRGARSTCAGGRLKSGDVDLASLVR